MLKTRIITAALLLPPILAIILWGGPLLLLLASCCFAVINFEFFRFSTLFSTRQCQQLVAASAVLPAGYFAYGPAGIAGGMLLSVMIVVVINILAVEREQHEIDFHRSFPACLTGLCYSGLFGTLLIVVAVEIPGRTILWLLLTVISADSVAYFGGRFFGGAKLALRTSPKKTVSGGICGLAGAVVGSVIAAWLLGVGEASCYCLSWQLALAGCWGLVVGVLAIFGDLAESLLKRVYDVKDSGSLLPGHGGLLDRIDALLFALPVLFFFP